MQAPDKWLMPLLACALALHLAAALYVGVERPWSISPVQDPLEYRLLAQNIPLGTFSLTAPPDTQPQLLRTPGYPLFLAATYALDGSGVLAIVLQQILLVAGGWILYRLLRAFNVGQRLSLVIAALYLLEPRLWMFSLQTMSEALASFLFVSLVALATVPKRSSLGTAAGVGVLAGLLLLVKPGLLVAAPFLLLLPLCREIPWRARAAQAAVAVLVMLVVLSPWFARNARLVGTPLLSSSSAYNFSLGLGSLAEQGALLADGPAIYDARGREGVNHTSFTAEKFASMQALQRQIIEREGVAALAGRQLSCAPHIWLAHGMASTLTVVHPLTAQQASLISMLEKMFGAVALLLVAAGIALSLADRRVRICSLLCAGMLLAVTVLNVCVSSDRMLIPLYPLILVFAGVALSSLAGHNIWQSLKRRL